MRYHIATAALALIAALPGSGGADSNPEPLLESLTPLYPAPEVATASGGDAAPQPDEEIRELFAGIRQLIGKQPATVSAAAAPQQHKQPGNPGLEVVMDPLGTPAFISVSRPRPLGAASAANPPDRSSLLQEADIFLARHRALLKLEEPARELQLTRLYRDGRGYSHLRYSQSYRGVPVWGSGLILHLDEHGAVSSMDGKYIPSPAGLQATPRIDSTRAVSVARRALDLPEGLDLPSSTTLVIHADGNGRTPVLAWQVVLEISLTRRMVTLVDAASARPMFSYNAARRISVAGSGPDTMGNIRSFNVWKEGEGEYHLIDTVRMGVAVGDPVTGDTPKGVIRILDARNGEQNLYPVVSRSATGGWLREGVNAAFNVSAAYDYFRDKHQRNSLDGESGSITAIVRVGDMVNASFVPDLGWLVFGDGDNFSGSLDIVAHEYTHGITSNSSGLIYLNQSGALDEALSDIFGEVVEHATFGSNDWVLGSQMQEPRLTRNMKQPARHEWSPGNPYPTRMSEYVALPLEDDNGGVHVNSSIINRAFYLLAEGMDNAIGIEAAAQIFYRANTVHLLPRSGFADMRRAAIQAAQELYPEKTAVVAAAFDAVEIFDTAPPSRPLPTRAIDAEDAVIMLIRDGENIYLGRRDSSQDDPDEGARLTSTPVQPMRPAVSADGRLVLFISEKFDLCTTSADHSTGEECMNKPGSFHSIAISPDARFFAFVPRDPDTGNVSSTICLLDTLGQLDIGICHSLLPAELDGSLSNTVAYADAMGFTADNRFLLFDALNRVTLANGQRKDIWSIYALDLASGSTVPVLPPMPMADTAYPSPSSVDPYLVTFEAFDATTNQIYVGNLLTGELVSVAETETNAIPALNGDDSAVIYTGLESSGQGYYPYLYRRGIDGLTPTGEATRWLAGGAAGVIYRSGEFVPMSRADIQVTQTVERKGAATGEDVVFAVTLLNRGPDSATGLMVNCYFPRQLEPHTLPEGCLQAENSATISCALPDLQPNQETTIRLTYRATATGEYSHRADAASDVEDPDKLNNMSFASVTISDRQPGSIPQNETGNRADNGDAGGGGGGAVLPLLLLLLPWLALHHGGNRQQLRG